MSSFRCEKCGKNIIDTEIGFVTGCEHYPHDCQCKNFPKGEKCVLCRIRAYPDKGSSIEAGLEWYEIDIPIKQLVSEWEKSSDRRTYLVQARRWFKKIRGLNEH